MRNSFSFLTADTFLFFHFLDLEVVGVEHLTGKGTRRIHQEMEEIGIYSDGGSVLILDLNVGELQNVKVGWIQGEAVLQMDQPSVT